MWRRTYIKLALDNVSFTSFMFYFVFSSSVNCQSVESFESGHFFSLCKISVKNQLKSMGVLFWVFSVCVCVCVCACACSQAFQFVAAFFVTKNSSEHTGNIGMMPRVTIVTDEMSPQV